LFTYTPDIDQRKGGSVREERAWHKGERARTYELEGGEEEAADLVGLLYTQRHRGQG
jgi:hypothetical protein